MDQEANDHHAEVKAYYGETLQTSQDLKTNACTCDATPPGYLRSVLAMIHPEVKAKYYGCGLVIPLQLEGLRVLDLGSGSGQDCFVLSKLIGPQGRVFGVDMTLEQLAVARAHQDYHQKLFGHLVPNLEFLQGEIERLGELNLAPQSFDLVVSNCVVNLANDKRKVFQGVFDLLKEGGEFYFSDVYSDRRIPKDLSEDPLLYGECLSGALYWNDFIALAKEVGFLDPRIVSLGKIAIHQEELQERLGGIGFHSVTVRLIKLKGLEPQCEDYGQALMYKGTLPEAAHLFELDRGHQFPTGRIERVCGNSYRMLKETRFAKHFEFFGDFSRHFGLFPGCGSSLPFEEGEAPGSCC
ncbi:MAG: methyltransferase type 11 [Candidatus Lambdaproteobacteria bacterium RIFOXYD1_FULL_56_27]|uniref:Arsenite methyltransferase n=1 Tax=Candidatus Lambdaproteobacteria bacterium RIFOXYD2_FULL_56_26 TaxID=1817773 RepID=A0A1F6GPC9_9PROT|nr:MAG: methyltransferase type 11 [Candidatus Lambdaproteobacteria bacterium RIFOXYD2_FULL_56_26]OGH04077.1 MAG: methyltransferase type 11 [Candidatus Lambdaproteobacteria bacterium RIFOXYC1_FULL_56_13]OGH09813.1 MAG: methyltransferase type 11 [Candidatus Lambdaproteobacteria bacterium RIFOXYD1_FULL_56_27]